MGGGGSRGRWQRVVAAEPPDRGWRGQADTGGCWCAGPQLLPAQWHCKEEGKRHKIASWCIVLQLGAGEACPLLEYQLWHPQYK